MSNDKLWKLMQIAGVLVGLVGIAGTIGAAALLVAWEVTWPAYFAFALCLSGIAIYLAGTTLAWWHG